jgi:hypothetical protein
MRGVASPGAAAFLTVAGLALASCRPEPPPRDWRTLIS